MKNATITKKAKAGSKAAAVQPPKQSKSGKSREDLVYELRMGQLQRAIRENARRADVFFLS